jgi:hypothetical protein
LAQAYQAKGRPVWFAFALERMQTRMYENLPHIVEGWSKNLYLGGRRSFPDEPLLRSLVPASLAGVMLYWLAPPVALKLSALAVLPISLLGAAALATFLSACFWMVTCAEMRIPPRFGLLYPLGALVVLYIVIRSTVRGDRAVEWKGRVYRGKT